MHEGDSSSLYGQGRAGQKRMAEDYGEDREDDSEERTYIFQQQKYLLNTYICKRILVELYENWEKLRENSGITFFSCSYLFQFPFHKPCLPLRQSVKYIPLHLGKGGAGKEATQRRHRPPV